MKYIEAVEKYDPLTLHNSIFLAGGITGCPDWQQDIRKLLDGTYLILLNPRRKNFPIGDPNAALQQITWEHNALRDVDNILFWFPEETICPIVLYELGAWSITEKPIFVGVHPEYQRRQDVEIQTRLVRPKVEIVYSLEALAEQVIMEVMSETSSERILQIREMITETHWQCIVPIMGGRGGFGETFCGHIHGLNMTFKEQAEHYAISMSELADVTADHIRRL